MRLGSWLHMACFFRAVCPLLRVPFHDLPQSHCLSTALLPPKRLGWLRPQPVLTSTQDVAVGADHFRRQIRSGPCLLRALWKLPRAVEGHPYPSLGPTKPLEAGSLLCSTSPASGTQPPLDLRCASVHDLQGAARCHSGRPATLRPSVVGLAHCGVSACSCRARGLCRERAWETVPGCFHTGAPHQGALWGLNEMVWMAGGRNQDSGGHRRPRTLFPRGQRQWRWGEPSFPRSQGLSAG